MWKYMLVIFCLLYSLHSQSSSLRDGIYKYSPENEEKIAITFINSEINRFYGSWVNIHEGALKGDPRALYIRGLMYVHGINVEKNSEMAFSLFLESANNDDSYGQLALARIYLCYDFRTQYCKFENREQGINIVLSLAEANFLPAQHLLAQLRLEGFAIEYDPDIALFWLNRASTNGYIPSKELLAHVSQEITFSTNYDQLRTGAILGDPEKLYKLSELFLNGWSVPKNINKAKALLEISAQLGYKPAIKKLKALNKNS